MCRIIKLVTNGDSEFDRQILLETMRGMIDLALIGKKTSTIESAETISPQDLITPDELEQVRRSLNETHADLVVRGMLDKSVRERLESVVRKEHKHIHHNNESVVKYIVRETIGTGIVEELLHNNPKITDIGYNGTHLIIESNDEKIILDNDKYRITEDYIVRLISKFANVNKKDFTEKNPIFDGRFENVRINAVHTVNTAPESGTTMALRVVRPRLALTEKNFHQFAPLFVLDLIRVMALTKSNTIIAGITGTGKTEVHKLFSSFIPFNDRIVLIEDTPETFMKEMFKDKDIFSWVTSDRVNVTQLIKAGLRNHPIWMMVTETRGSEAYEMIQAVLSGHSIVTSLHAISASAIPARFVNMSKMGYQFDERALMEDIRRYFHFGLHIKKTKWKNRVVRYLSEIIWFDVDKDIHVFKQRFVNGIFRYEVGSLPEEFLMMMEESGLTSEDLRFPPSGFRGEMALDKEGLPYQFEIPIDETGRPDYKKIEQMGTTLEELLGHSEKKFVPIGEQSVVDKVTTKDGFLIPQSSVERVSTNNVDAKIRQVKQHVKQEQNAKSFDEEIDELLSITTSPVRTQQTVSESEPKRQSIHRKQKSAEALLREKKEAMRKGKL